MKNPFIAQLLVAIALLFLVSCTSESPKPKTGMWRASFNLGGGNELPVLIEFTDRNTLYIFNAEEKIEVTNIQLVGDSISIKHPVYEGVFKGTFTDELISGDWIKPSLDRVVPFTMSYSESNRFTDSEASSEIVTGNWEMVFSEGVEDDRYIAKGIFNQHDQVVTGTIRTTTGDYRYLEGVMDGTTMRLSTFDGAHAFLFEAEVGDSIMNGTFYSGNHWKEPFRGKRNETYELPSENSLTYLNEGYDKLAFSFPDTDGKMVSLEDERFQNKVVVVQIMGTWCPNCLDETRYYTQYYNENKSDALEFISLAFEYAPTEERAIAGINRLRKTVGVPYPILLAQYGTSSKTKAQEKLPMLNHILSYPTTIFIDKKGAVRKIHTGFNGPATGEKYTAFVKEFESFVAELEAE